MITKNTAVGSVTQSQDGVLGVILILARITCHNHSSQGFQKKRSMRCINNLDTQLLILCRNLGPFPTTNKSREALESPRLIHIVSRDSDPPIRLDVVNKDSLRRVKHPSIGVGKPPITIHHRLSNLTNSY